MKFVHSFLFVIACFAATAGYAQRDKAVSPLLNQPERYVYDKDLLDLSFHMQRREALREMMPANSAAVFFTNPVRNRANDVDFPYHPDPNFYYLTGYREPNAVVVIFKDLQTIDGKKTTDVIFVQDRDPAKEVWEGRRYGKEGTKNILGFSVVKLNTDFEDFISALKKYETVLITGTPKGAVNESRSKADLYDMSEAFKSKSGYPDGNINSNELRGMMARLRQIKTEEELVLMRKAIEITCEAQVELMKNLNPKMTEYQAEALVEYVFAKNGAEHVGFPSIVGAGENSCILHYITNRRQLTGSELLVTDIGAEYHGYTADVTRTLPVNGKFSPEQKIIYELVLKAQEAGIAECLNGKAFRDPHNVAFKIITKGLIEHGIIKTDSETGNYFMHGTSHYLGLDVHDPGTYGKLEPNMVITVEPGIYIAEGSDCDPKWWNIGVRIEDDILITRGDPVNLSESAPRRVVEIEKIMAGNKATGTTK